MSNIENRVRILPHLGGRDDYTLEYKGHYVTLPTEMGEVLEKELKTKREKADRKFYDEHHLKEAADSLNFWLKVLHPDLFGTDEAVKELYDWKPEHFQVNADFKGMYYNDGDEDCPFLSERFLYNLLGKSDARSLLGLVKRALGTKGISQ